MATSRNTAVFELRTETGDSVNDIKKMDQSLRDLEKTTKKTQTTMSDSKGTDKFEKEYGIPAPRYERTSSLMKTIPFNVTSQYRVYQQHNAISNYRIYITV